MSYRVTLLNGMHRIITPSHGVWIMHTNQNKHGGISVAIYADGNVEKRFANWRFDDAIFGSNTVIKHIVGEDEAAADYLGEVLPAIIVDALGQ